MTAVRHEALERSLRRQLVSFLLLAVQLPHIFRSIRLTIVKLTALILATQCRTILCLSLLLRGLGRYPSDGFREALIEAHRLDESVHDFDLPAAIAINLRQVVEGAIL